MGAAVMLFNREDRLFERVLSDERGIFDFSGLLPDVYSLRITLASFVPAVKNHIVVQPGMRSVLNVSMATLFSSIRLVSPGEHPSLLDDDWKWALRTATSTRPVMRLLAGVAMDETKRHRAIFSDTRGILILSAGDGSLVSGFGSSADMGTAFAVETSLFGNNQLQFAGNMGSGAQSGIPTAAFRATYNRDAGSESPQVSVTMHELFLPGRMGAAIFGEDSGVPMLRAVSADFDDRARVGDALTIQYGVSLDSVSFVDHLNYLSPYARAIYSLGRQGEISFSYTAGNARPNLAGSGTAESQLQQNVAALGMFPLVSLRNSQSEVQRGKDMELGYTRTTGSRKFGFSVYRETVDNLALTISAPGGFLPMGDILPDFYSGTAIFNGGNFSNVGYTVSASQAIGEHVNASLTYGSAGALTAPMGEVVSNDPDELRAMIHVGRQQSVTARVEATSRRSGTHIVASYQIADDRWEVAEPSYSTDTMRPQPGFNVYFRQPIPGFSMLPWRMEITADLRNLLQQGYLPLTTTDGSRLVLMETPRMFRGGVSFIF
jgi:hypothetical protein